MIRLENVETAKIKNVKAEGTADAFVRVEGGDSKKVKLSDNKIAGAKKEIEIANVVKPANEIAK